MRQDEAGRGWTRQDEGSNQEAGQAVINRIAGMEDRNADTYLAVHGRVSTAAGVPFCDANGAPGVVGRRRGALPTPAIGY